MKSRIEDFLDDDEVMTMFRELGSAFAVYGMLLAVLWLINKM